jgi:hypothetical protein
LIQVDGKPASVEERIIRQLREQLAQFEAIRGSDDLKRGDVVRVCRGPLRGCEAIFDTRLNGTQRARILLKYLENTVIKATVHMDDIERRFADLSAN